MFVEHEGRYDRTCSLGSLTIECVHALQALFVDHEGYLGALGAYLLYGADEEGAARAEGGGGRGAGDRRKG